MAILIKDLEMPEKCDGCKFEDRFGGCVLLNCIGNDTPYEEFDEEWRNARKEGRRLKYCPLKQERDLLAERQTEKDHFRDVRKKQPRKAINERVYCKDCKYLMFSDCYGKCSKTHRGIVNPDDYCEHGKRGKK